MVQGPNTVRVLVLAPYPLERAPSQRFRWEQYIGLLREHGIFLEPSCFLNDRGMDIVHLQGAWGKKALATFGGMLRRLRDVIVARRYDLVFVHRESVPMGPAWVEWILDAIGVPYVFDFDDAIYMGDTSEANRRLSWLTSAYRTETVVEKANLVLAGNAHLAEWAKHFTSRVVVVPTTIDTDKYQPITHRKEGPLCVGWTGSMSTIEHLNLLGPVLRDLQRDRGIRIRVIGDPSYRIDGATVEALAWSAATELEALSAIDVGIMPLPDEEWARGKCGLKALQYMALGIPTVLSPVGVNRQIARDGAALLAETVAEWGGVLRGVIDDSDLRASIGNAGRVRVEREFSITATLPLWTSALRDAAGGHR